MTGIDRVQLTDLAKTHRLVPITRTLFADAETPVGVYRKLAGGRPGTFLLESAEPGASFSRWSFVGVNAVATLTADGGAGAWVCAPSAIMERDESASAMAQTIERENDMADFPWCCAEALTARAAR